MKNGKSADAQKPAAAKWPRTKKLALTLLFAAAAAGVVAEGVQKVSELRHENLNHVRQLPTV